MLAISIHQPAAALLAHGWCRLNERRWATSLRGPILIHASESLQDRDWALFAVPEVAGAFRKRSGVRRLEDAPRGALVGLAELTHCVPVPRLYDFLPADPPPHPTPGDARVNPMHPDANLLAFRDARPLPEPVCHPGGKGLFAVDARALERVAAQLARVGDPWGKVGLGRAEALS